MEFNEVQAVNRAYELLSAEEACKGQAHHLRIIKDKLEKETLTLSIIGQFKRGKSTLANYILDDDILPVGIVPITSAVTRVYYGEKSAEVHFFNGDVKPIDFENLSEYISEQQNNNNKLGVSSVVIRTPSKFLKNGIEFVDTPGVGSFHKNNTEVAYQYMKESDGVIFLLSVDSPINEIEIEFLKATKEFASKFYFAVNKSDLVSEVELAQYIGYCQGVLQQIMGYDKEPVKIFPVSAKTGDGIKELTTSVSKDLKKNARAILERSSILKLRDIIDEAIDQLRFYWKAMNMEYKDLDIAFSSIDEYTDIVKKEATEQDSNFEIKFNEIKIELSDKVQEFFCIRYVYEIEETSPFKRTMTKPEFEEKVNALVDDLRNTLDSILLYREDNAYIVVRRIANINLLSNRLREIKRQINENLEGRS